MVATVVLLVVVGKVGCGGDVSLCEYYDVGLSNATNGMTTDSLNQGPTLIFGAQEAPCF